LAFTVQEGYGVKDTEIRGLLFKKYYERRRDGFVRVGPDEFEGAISEKDILWLSGQLGEHGLIHWKSIDSMAGPVGDLGRISADGIDVIEG
jgi:hypothetical protein